MKPILTLNDVDFSYGRRTILTGIDLEIPAGRSVAITGRSGSGKSTLLSLVAGLLRPRRGSVCVLETRVDRLRGGSLARFRREHLGIVFQSGELLPAMTAVENVAMPLLLDGRSWPDASDAARRMLGAIGIDEPSHDLPAANLSGGERQRTALARALITGPELIVADEPTGALDAKTRDDVAELLFSLPGARGCGLLVVTHDPDVAARADIQLTLVDGGIAQPLPAVAG